MAYKILAVDILSEFVAYEKEVMDDLNINYLPRLAGLFDLNLGEVHVKLSNDKYESIHVYPKDNKLLACTPDNRIYMFIVGKDV